MPVKTYRDTTMATFMLIWLLSFIYSIMSVVQYTEDPIKNKFLKKHFTISIPVCIISGLIVTCDYNSHKRRTPVPV